MHAGLLLRPPSPKDLRKLWRVLSLKSPSSSSVKKELPVQHGDDSKETLLQATGPVPRGFLAVYAGQEMRRYVIPASYLSLPEFRGLMERAEEEFGFEQEGGLRFPCEEGEFEEVLIKCFAKQGKKNKKERDKA